MSGSLFSLGILLTIWTMTARTFVSEKPAGPSNKIAGARTETNVMRLNHLAMAAILLWERVLLATGPFHTFGKPDPIAVPLGLFCGIAPTHFLCAGGGTSYVLSGVLIGMW